MNRHVWATPLVGADNRVESSLKNSPSRGLLSRSTAYDLCLPVKSLERESHICVLVAKDQVFDGPPPSSCSQPQPVVAGDLFDSELDDAAEQVRGQRRPEIVV